MAKKSVTKMKPQVRSKKSAAKASLLQLQGLDEKILSLASDRYAQILQKIDFGKKRIDAERRTALMIGHRILEKAKDVRDQLVAKAPAVYSRRKKRTRTRANSVAR